MADHTSRERDDLTYGSGLAEQWIGFLLAPAAFFIHLQAAYSLVPYACAYRNAWWLHALGAGAIIVAAIGLWVAWRVWDRAGRQGPDDEGSALARTRFLALVGIMGSAIFVLILAAQWSVGFFFSPCQ